jgi:hypothetical protein
MEGYIGDFTPNEYLRFSRTVIGALPGRILEAKGEVYPKYYHLYKELETPSERDLAHQPPKLYNCASAPRIWSSAR